MNNMFLYTLFDAHPVFCKIPKFLHYSCFLKSQFDFRIEAESFKIYKTV